MLIIQKYIGQQNSYTMSFGDFYYDVVIKFSLDTWLYQDYIGTLINQDKPFVHL